MKMLISLGSIPKGSVVLPCDVWESLTGTWQIKDGHKFFATSPAKKISLFPPFERLNEMFLTNINILAKVTFCDFRLRHKSLAAVTWVIRILKKH